MVSFEFFVKAMPPSLSELKVLPSFCFAFKIPDDVTVTNMYSVPALKSKIGEASTYSRLRNKRRGMLINFWAFFQGLHAY